MNTKLLLHTDCRHFRGDIPCKPHKLYGVHCDGCSHYDPTDSHILIIKLGALGDVIRTTPLLHRLKQDHPRAMIWWLTLSPEILPPQVDVKLSFSPESLTALRSVRFKLLYNFDKEKEACALTDQLSAYVKKGFILKDGKCAPIDKDAEHKFATGIFDDLNKANTKSYPQELFEMCGMEFRGEKYILPVNEWIDQRWKLNPRKKIIGLNTGCGGRWTSRIWPDTYWVETAKRLKKAGYEVMLLGGEQEHTKNLAFAKKSGARYFGHYPLQQFISLVNRCDLVVTAVTMAMHITIGLGKKIVLFNNIFNKHEFELYGLGEILEPEFDCTCFYSPTCPNNCMQYLKPERVVSSIQRLLPRK